MSLFKVCPWWHTQCPDVSPTYDCYLLHCCRFGLYDGEKDYIVVGSHSGHLSIYKPSAAESNGEDGPDADDDTATNSFKPTDVLLETKLPNPIIEILSAKFVS